MTPDRQAEVERKAKQDAAAHRNGYPNADRCPYSDVKSATEWVKQFNLALAKAKQ